MQRSVTAKLILPSLTEAESPFWRPIKYSLFPPIGLATLAAYFRPDDTVTIIDQHVQKLEINDAPDIVGIQVYITNAKRAYQVADAYRARGSFVILGGLHVTALPNEALAHADAILTGPGEAAFPEFIEDFRRRQTKQVYHSFVRTLENTPQPRRDLIQRHRYLVPNSLVISRGCPHHCDFCYKDAFFKGSKSFYTQTIDDALAEIERLPGKHLYFLDDHLLANPSFVRGLFSAMHGMGRIFQGAATVQSILDGDVIEVAAEAGLRSVFVGFETLDIANLRESRKIHNIGRDYEKAIQRLHNLGIMINGSFVFGLDSDTTDVFKQTVDWAVKMGITTSTFHIATPYPGTRYYEQMQKQGRLISANWDDYDTRHAVFRPMNMTTEELEAGYADAYKSFYTWGNIINASLHHGTLKHQLKHFFYASGWKKFELFWNMVIQLKRLNQMTPLLEALLSKVSSSHPEATMPVKEEAIESNIIK